MQRLVHQAKQQEYLRYLKQNGKAISKIIYKAVSTELIKLKEKAARIQGWIALQRVSAYSQFVFKKLTKIKKIY